MQFDSSDYQQSTLRLLVCDDSPEECKALAVLLRQQGYEIDQAADGQSALTFLKSRRYAMLLLDLQMPPPDGFDVLTWVQKNQSNLPVVVMSGLRAEEIGDGISRLPTRELPPLLMKPITPNQLLGVVQLKLAGELP